MIHKVLNTLLPGRHGKPVVADVFYIANGQPKPVVVFSHGFKGFKDWGPFNLIAEHFAAKNMVFVKFNFSHNGTTPEQPVEFADLEAFGNDNFTIELDDLQVVLDWVLGNHFPAAAEVNTTQLYLLGHSRGGGISILKAREELRVKKLCTWASVNEFSKYWTPEQLNNIKEQGVVYIPNARTGQQMPIRWQMYENYFANLHRLFIPDAVRQLTIPFLIIHGTDDETVPYTSAVEMHGWNKNNQLLLIEHGNHNFGGRHPYTLPSLTEDLEDVVNETILFYKQTA